MSNKYKTLVHEWFEEVWNQRKAETIDRLLAPEAVLHGIVDENGLEPRGPAAFRAFHKKFLEAFPNLTVEVLDTVSEGSKLACRLSCAGRTGETASDSPPPKRTSNLQAWPLLHIQGGKIIEGWNNFRLPGDVLAVGCAQPVVNGGGNPVRDFGLRILIKPAVKLSVLVSSSSLRRTRVSVARVSSRISSPWVPTSCSSSAIRFS